MTTEQHPTELRFALFVSMWQTDPVFINALQDWHQPHAESIDWIWSEFRPDLVALFGVTANTTLIAYLDELNAIPPIAIRSITDLESNYQTLSTAWQSQTESIVELATITRSKKSERYAIPADPPSISTLLVQEWVRRIELKAAKPEQFSPELLPVAMTLVRFHDRKVLRDLLEQSIEFLTRLSPTNLTASQLAESILAASRLYRVLSFSDNIPVATTKELMLALERLLSELTGRKHVTTGLYRERLSQQLPTTITAQSNILNALTSASWIFGNECLALANDLALQLSRRANFAGDGATLTLPDGNDRGLLLCDGVHYSTAILNLYDANGDSRWLAQAETICAIWVDRFANSNGWLDWFSKNHPLRGSTPAPYELGLLSQLALRIGRMTQNDRWEELVDDWIAFSGRFILEYPRESVSLIETIIRIFGHDPVLQTPWEIGKIPTDWRIAVGQWIPDIRIDWRNPSSDVVFCIGEHRIKLNKPWELQRVFAR